MVKGMGAARADPEVELSFWSERFACKGLWFLLTKYKAALSSAGQMVHQGRKRQRRKRASCHLVKIHHLLPSVIPPTQLWSVPECAALH